MLVDELDGRQPFQPQSTFPKSISIPRKGWSSIPVSIGVPVLFGHGDFAVKLDRLERIYGELEPRLTALQYIDLNVADRVIVKVDPKYAAGRNEKQGRKGLS